MRTITKDEVADVLRTIADELPKRVNPLLHPGDPRGGCAYNRTMPNGTVRHCIAGEAISRLGLDTGILSEHEKALIQQVISRDPWGGVAFDDSAAALLGDAQTLADGNGVIDTEPQCDGPERWGNVVDELVNRGLIGFTA